MIVAALDRLKRHFRMLAHQSIDDFWDEARHHHVGAADSYVTGSRVGQELKPLHAASQVVEYGNAAVEECATIQRGLDALRTPIEETNAERMLEIGDRSGDDRMRDGKTFRRSRNAAGIRHSNKHVEVAQFHATAHTIRPLHDHALCLNGYSAVAK